MKEFRRKRERAERRKRKAAGKIKEEPLHQRLLRKTADMKPSALPPRMPSQDQKPQLKRKALASKDEDGTQHTVKKSRLQNEIIYESGEDSPKHEKENDEAETRPYRGRIPCPPFSSSPEPETRPATYHEPTAPPIAAKDPDDAITLNEDYSVENKRSSDDPSHSTSLAPTVDGKKSGALFDNPPHSASFAPTVDSAESSMQDVANGTED